MLVWRMTLQGTKSLEIGCCVARRCPASQMRRYQCQFFHFFINSKFFSLRVFIGACNLTDLFFFFFYKYKCTEQKFYAIYSNGTRNRPFCVGIVCTPHLKRFYNGFLNKIIRQGTMSTAPSNPLNRSSLAAITH